MIIISLLLTGLNANAISLKNFETDGCTYFVDGTLKRPKLWQHCCYIHDIKYWIGGDLNDQEKSDFALKNCVEEVAGIDWATFVYRGVKLGHYSPIKNKRKWSWGFENKKNPYEKLNSEELFYAQSAIQKLDFPTEIIERAIAEYFTNN